MTAPHALDASVQPLSHASRLRLLSYAATPIFIFNFAAPYLGLIGLPVVFFLKNRLHLTASQQAMFNLIVSLPLIFGFVFGFIRDRWSPFGRGDRGHIVVFGLAAAVAYVGMAGAPPGYGILLVGGLTVTFLMQFVWSAALGLATAVGRHHAMSGQMSTAINVANLIPTSAAVLLGGLLSGVLEGGRAEAAAHVIFLLGAALMAAIAAFGAFGPGRLFEDAVRAPDAASPRSDLRALARNWVLYPVILIQLLWSFQPAAGTAMQYHMANELHATDAQVGQFFAIFYAGFVPILLLYGWLAQHLRLKVLLWIGAVLAVPQMASLLFMHSARGALLAAIPMGLLGGVGQAAFMDLAMRACPKGQEGTMMMLVWSMYFIATRFGDIWGASLYQGPGGFNAAVYATIGVYALILPLVAMVPRRIGDTIDAA